MGIPIPTQYICHGKKSILTYLSSNAELEGGTFWTVTEDTKKKLSFLFQYDKSEVKVITSQLIPWLIVQVAEIRIIHYNLKND